METKDLYKAADNRYDNQQMYTFCGHSGVILPKLSLGFWHNFGSVDPYERSRAITHYAFDHGITHFDLANNYGPVYGSAEETMGRLIDDSFRPYRDELFISTKAGYDMWPGPYGNGGSRKYLMSSLDQSLKRMHLDYVDLFYSHRYDPNTPIEETLQALVDIVNRTGAKSTNLNCPESAEELCAKCVHYAEHWAPTAKRIWEEKERFHPFTQYWRDTPEGQQEAARKMGSGQL
jgi:L-glyceraldehyde 3-phosphate reductase